MMIVVAAAVSHSPLLYTYSAMPIHDEHFYLPYPPPLSRYHSIYIPN